MRILKQKTLICPKCGNRTKFKITLYPDDYDEYKWINVDCGKCKQRMLFYNGA